MKIMILGLLLCLALLGCQKPTSKPEGKAGATKDLPSFKEGKGLSLPNETRQCIGFQTVEVTERKIIPEITTEVQVYRTSENMVYASGLVSAEQAGQLKAGQAVRLITKARKPLDGTMVRLDEQTKTATGQIEVLVEIPAPGQEYPIGTFLTAAFAGAKETTVIVIPRSALLRAAEGDFVFAVNGDHLFRTAVKVGAETADVVEITDGLYSGDKVVSASVQTLWLTELRFVKGGAACAD